MVFGRDIRLNRITRNGRIICVTLDHGVSSGPLQGIQDIGDTIAKVEEGGATTILVHKGIIRSLPAPRNVGVIMHLSASTSLGLAPNQKMQIATVEEAIRLGADAVSVHINVGGKEEPEMLAKLGRVSDECDRWGFPCIAMMYPRGENVPNPHDPEKVAHAARIGAELGADIVKTVYTGDPDSFKTVVKSCPVPVAIAGGPKTKNDQEALEMVREAMDAGAIGVTFGRNIFQHPDPTKMVSALFALVMENASVDEALEVLSGSA
ncbi:MAG: 2-amino-3,7-dideoxy-D-threo-hept-6-ulosonate synthase [Thaumarchaeota archaeon]|nr:2-amino-3,7-dideoxy-D-threo-hept-6-ulosonate synthase [Nitrososphaerota archaeon]MCL5318731.1 2-amino-3,7-dideoxy-D-threo-hept-6-ulosonate synthase [Nitrososphaerota archaeon]